MDASDAPKSGVRGPSKNLLGIGWTMEEYGGRIQLLLKKLPDSSVETEPNR